MKIEFPIPKEVSFVTETLKKANFESFLVGGCVRDLFLNKTPKDWDITTNATPEQIIPLFEKTFYENTFGTVGVVQENTDDETLKVIEVTPYRIESGYSDNRHPDNVIFSQKIEDDLKRRDFTVNALAYDPITKEIVDLYDGIGDIRKKIIKTVGNAEDRFKEDGLRILRAVRFFSEIGFEIEHETEKAIFENTDLLKNISKERIRDEFTKIIMSPNPMDGLMVLKKLNLIHYIMPELEKTFDVEQSRSHKFNVWEHSIRSLQTSADKNFPLEIRLTALLHDISKPETRRREWDLWTFYGHEVLGSKKTLEILTNLRFPSKVVEKVTTLVRWHMFFSDTEQISLSAVRRMIVNVGKDNIWDLMNVRICDRVGTGRPKEDPYRLRKYHAMIEEALRDPISANMLKTDGKKIMEIAKIPPGPKVGFIQFALLEEVLDDPSKNNFEYLENRVLELVKLEDGELIKLGKKGKETKEQKNEENIREIRKRHSVK